MILIKQVRLEDSVPAPEHYNPPCKVSWSVSEEQHCILAPMSSAEVGIARLFQDQWLIQHLYLCIWTSDENIPSWKGSTRIIESNLMLNPIYMSAQNLLPCCPVLFQVLWCQLVSPASAAVTLVTCSRVIAESHFSISLYHLRAALLKSPSHLCTKRGGYLWALSKSKFMCSNAHTLSGCRLLLGDLFPLKWKFVMFPMIKLSQYVFRSQFGICCIFP